MKEKAGRQLADERTRPIVELLIFPMHRGWEEEEKPRKRMTRQGRRSASSSDFSSFTRGTTKKRQLRFRRPSIDWLLARFRQTPCTSTRKFRRHFEQLHKELQRARRPAELSLSALTPAHLDASHGAVKPGIDPDAKRSHRGAGPSRSAVAMPINRLDQARWQCVVA